jgi:hypothetical protein
VNETWEECADWKFRSVSECEDDDSEDSCNEDISEQSAKWAVAENISHFS